MKQLILLAVILILSFSSYAQDSKFSVEVNYPVSFGNSYFGEAYDGIVDIGANYRIINLDLISLGTSLNAGIFKNQDERLAEFIDVYVYTIQPGIFGELNLPSLSRLRPSVGVGYSFMIFNQINQSPLLDRESFSETEGGINLNFGIAYDLTSRLFIQIQYDYIKLLTQDDYLRSTVNSKINIFKAGLGYRF